MGGHKDARLRAIHARLPRPFSADDSALAVVLGGALTDVPDVAVVVLRVPVQSVLGKSAVKRRRVLDHGRDYSVDEPRTPGYVKDVCSMLAILHALVDEGCAGCERKPRIVDRVSAEVGRIEGWRGGRGRSHAKQGKCGSEHQTQRRN